MSIDMNEASSIKTQHRPAGEADMSYLTTNKGRGTTDAHYESSNTGLTADSADITDIIINAGLTAADADLTDVIQT